MPARTSTWVLALFVQFEGLTPGQYKTGGRGLTVAWAVLATPLGRGLFASLGNRLVGFTFLEGEDRGGALAELFTRWPEARLLEDPVALAPFAAALGFFKWGSLRKEALLALEGAREGPGLVQVE